MRFKNRFTLREREGETRVVRKFLWLPRDFSGPETRWLEHARIREHVCRERCLGLGGISDAWCWTETGFVDIPEAV